MMFIGMGRVQEEGFGLLLGQGGGVRAEKGAGVCVEGTAPSLGRWDKDNELQAEQAQTALRREDSFCFGFPLF